MKRQNIKSQGLKRIFGLISVQAEEGHLVLSRSLTRLSPLLDDLSHGKSDEYIYAAYKGIKPDEIRTAKAYLCRFGADEKAPLALPQGQKAILLDENIPYTLLPYVQKNFGLSSHVEAEGLSRQNLAPHNKVHAKALDTLICKFAMAQQFTAILTKDTDFIALFKNPDHPVRNLHVFLVGGSADVQDILDDNRELIMKTLAEPSPRITAL